MFSYGVSQYDKNSTYKISFNVFEFKVWVLHYRNIWNEFETQLFEKLLITELINGEGKYMQNKFPW